MGDRSGLRGPKPSYSGEKDARSTTPRSNVGFPVVIQEPKMNAARMVFTVAGQGGALKSRRQRGRRGFLKSIQKYPEVKE